MPSYEYECQRCGRFSANRSIEDFALPTACPGCAVAAPRSLGTPRLGGMDRARFLAAATNERSANAPRRSAHGPGCRCCRPAAPGRPAEAAKGFPDARPWMISH